MKIELTEEQQSWVKTKVLELKDKGAITSGGFFRSKGVHISRTENGTTKTVCGESDDFKELIQWLNEDDIEKYFG